MVSGKIVQVEDVVAEGAELVDYTFKDADKVYYYGELDRVTGYTFVGMNYSFEGYRILWFRQRLGLLDRLLGRKPKLVAVFIDWPGRER